MNPSTNRMMVVGLFLFGIVWVALMGLVALMFGGGKATAANVPDDGSIKAAVTNLDRGKDFQISAAVKVTDKAGKILEGMTEQDIEVYEDGELVHIQNFMPAGQGAIRLALLIDCSPSMRANQKIISARPAALTLIRMLRDRTDHVGLYFFNGVLFERNKVEIVPVEPLNLLRRENIWRAIEYVPGQLNEGSPITGTIDKALDSLAKTSGRRALVCLTDGTESDEERAELETKKQGVIDKAKELKVPLVMVNIPANDADEKMMRDLADQTNGKYIAVPDPQKLESIFQEIGKSLQDECTFTYTSPDPVENGRKRNLTVHIRNGAVGTRADGSYNVPGVLATGGRSGSSSGGAASTGTIFLALAGALAVLLLVPQVIRFGPRIDAEESAAPAAAAARPVVSRHAAPQVAAVGAKPARPKPGSSAEHAVPPRSQASGPTPKVW